MEFRILGPLEVRSDGGVVTLGGIKPRMVIAVLAMNANQAVHPERLAHALWGEDAPPSAVKTLQVYVSRLRTALGDPEILAMTPAGYRLRVRPGELDAERFDGLVAEARRALAAGEGERAAVWLREAQALWRGPPLADLALEGFAQPQIEHLEEQRLAAVELRVEADLTAGRHSELVAELRALVAANPTRERLAGHLMLALYRSGRQADALDAYHRARTHLAAELGLEPGPALKALQADILDQRTALELSPAPAVVTTRGPPHGDPPPEDSPPAAATATAMAEPARPDARRFVSVLAARADVEDPEVLHGLFDRCASVVEQHGGTVERYLGDAFIGFFGLAGSHGDDHLRAARAAVQMRTSAGELRMGLEAGEVFLGAGARGAPIATGAAITVAGQLAERAAEGEILLGERVRHAVAAEASIDGDGGRLLELHGDEPALLRVARTPFVGRTRELSLLRAEFEHVCGEGVCRLVTVVGPPGIGKSRLAGEFLAAAGGDGATVLAGRCLSYGEGTTYRALADIVQGLGADPRRRVEALLAGDEPAVRGILRAVGLSREPAQAEEISWALRRLLERLARDRPVVLAVEDIHWAEPALLELLDHVVALSSGSPILLVCLTRPELLEARPEWAAPQPNRSLLVLDALADAAARELAERLGAGDHVPRIVERAEGNPLFVEQLVAVDAGRPEGELPASIQAVLAARIDRLEPSERTLLQHGAIEGRTFHVGALQAGLPGAELHATARLVSLTRKGLLGADRSEFAGEEAFRFTHALIREAAYAGVTKRLRAQLHALVAEWLGSRSGAADEVVGFHLERACLLASELGRDGPHERALATSAAARLEAASRLVLARGDPAAASALLERALALVRFDDAARGALLPALGASLFEAGRTTEAARVLDEAIAQAREPRLVARAQIERELVRLETEMDPGVEQPAHIAEATLRILEREGDDLGQSRAWSLKAQLAWTRGHVARADDAWCVAAQCARRAGDDRELFTLVGWRATAAVLGPSPVDDAIRRCEEFRVLVASSPVAMAWTINPLASLYAMRGEFDRAERYLGEGAEILGELGGLDSSVSHHEALVRLLAGRPELAEPPLRQAAETLSSMASRSLLATTTAMLAQAVYAQRRPVEADELCRATAQSAAADDIVTQVIWRGVQAKILAGDGRCEEAEALAHAAVGLVEPTDLLSHHGDALLDLAEVLAACGRRDESCAAARQGLSLYERKGNTVAASRARSLLHDQPEATP